MHEITNKPKISICQLALELAAKAHQRQRRKRSGLPYITHCVIVRDLVAQNGGGEIAQTVALLHDVIEDSSYSIAEFPQTVQDMVKDLTILKTDNKIDAIKRLHRANKDTVLVKLCDRYHNMVDTIRFLDYGFKKEWIETTKLLLSIAKEKGLQRTQVFLDLDRVIKQLAKNSKNVEDTVVAVPAA